MRVEDFGMAPFRNGITPVNQRVQVQVEVGLQFNAPNRCNY